MPIRRQDIDDFTRRVDSAPFGVDDSVKELIRLSTEKDSRAREAIQRKIDDLRGYDGKSPLDAFGHDGEVAVRKYYAYEDLLDHLK